MTDKQEGTDDVTAAMEGVKHTPAATTDGEATTDATPATTTSTSTALGPETLDMSAVVTSPDKSKADGDEGVVVGGLDAEKPTATENGTGTGTGTASATSDAEAEAEAATRTDAKPDSESVGDSGTTPVDGTGCCLSNPIMGANVDSACNSSSSGNLMLPSTEEPLSVSTTTTNTTTSVGSEADSKGEVDRSSVPDTQTTTPTEECKPCPVPTEASLPAEQPLTPPNSIATKEAVADVTSTPMEKQGRLPPGASVQRGSLDGGVLQRRKSGKPGVDGKPNLGKSEQELIQEIARIEKRLCSGIDAKMMEFKKKANDIHAQDTTLNQKLNALVSRAERLANEPQGNLERDLKNQIHREFQEASQRSIAALTQSLEASFAPKMHECFANSLKQVAAQLPPVVPTTVTPASMFDEKNLDKVVQAAFGYLFKTTLIPAYESQTNRILQHLTVNFDQGLQQALQKHQDALKQLYQAPTSGPAPAVMPTDDQLQQQLQTSVSYLIESSRRALDSANEAHRRVLESIAESQKTILDTLSKIPAPTAPQMDSAPPLDPIAELGRILSSEPVQYEQALAFALSRGDPSLVLWVCQHVEAAVVLASGQLSQPTITGVIRQLSTALETETELKVKWLEKLIPYLSPGPMAQQCVQQARSAFEAIIPTLKDPKLLAECTHTSHMCKFMSSSL